MLGLAESKIDESRANMESTGRNCFKRGVSIYRTPFGYRRNGTFVDQQLVGRVDPALDGKALVPDPITGPIVRDLFRRRANGEWLASLRAWLNRKGITPPSAAASAWETTAVRRMLSREVYLGVVRWHGERKEAHKALNGSGYIPACSAPDAGAASQGREQERRDARAAQWPGQMRGLLVLDVPAAPQTRPSRTAHHPRGVGRPARALAQGELSLSPTK